MTLLKAPAATILLNQDASPTPLLAMPGLVHIMNVRPFNRFYKDRMGESGWEVTTPCGGHVQIMQKDTKHAPQAPDPNTVITCLLCLASQLSVSP